MPFLLCIHPFQRPRNLHSPKASGVGSRIFKSARWVEAEEILPPSRCWKVRGRVKRVLLNTWSKQILVWELNICKEMDGLVIGLLFFESKNLRELVDVIYILGIRWCHLKWKLFPNHRFSGAILALRSVTFVAWNRVGFCHKSLSYFIFWGLHGTARCISRMGLLKPTKNRGN